MIDLSALVGIGGGAIGIGSFVYTAIKQKVLTENHLAHVQADITEIKADLKHANEKLSTVINEAIKTRDSVKLIKAVCAERHGTPIINGDA